MPLRQIAQRDLGGERGQTEVGDADLAAPVDHDVGGLQVAMQDAAFVRGGEPGTDLPGELDGLVLGQSSDTPEERGQILAVDVLHRQEMQALDHAEVVDPADIRMRHLPRDAYFVAESDQRGFADVRRRQKLQRDGLVEDHVERFVDLAHAAAAEQAEDAVAAGQDRAGVESGPRPRRSTATVGRSSRSRSGLTVGGQHPLDLPKQFQVAAARALTQTPAVRPRDAPAPLRRSPAGGRSAPA